MSPKWPNLLTAENLTRRRVDVQCCIRPELLYTPHVCPLYQGILDENINGGWRSLKGTSKEGIEGVTGFWIAFWVLT
jgi:hypothetical protein